MNNVFALVSKSLSQLKDGLDGVAHTIGKPTILITQKSEDVPFDLRYLRYIPYQLTPRGMKEFEKTFKETVINVLGLYGPT